MKADSSPDTDPLLLWLTPDQVAQTRDWLAHPENHLILHDNPDYPPLLKELSDRPDFLFVKGNASLLSRPMIAIVGSRNATRQGCLDAEAFAESLSDAGITIVSGLADGIDAAAHRGALRGRGATVAVIGTGADRVYPAVNRGLAQDIATRGVIVSEFVLGSVAQKWHFPKRNRIIAGMSLGCLVVEASLTSGSIITARLGLEQGREIFAIPGSIHSPLSKGCHHLIRDGAKLVETARDILEELQYQISGLQQPANPIAPRDIDEKRLDAAALPENTERALK
ncbi:MAG: DNA-processing protein DprA [Betaproteobacteria bacterium]|nr:DNA-processing protein DprA [Betaproteobacteria bacterium]